MKAKDRDVAVGEKPPSSRRGYAFHEAGVRLRQVHAEEMDLLPRHAADHPDRCAEVHLGMARAHAPAERTSLASGAWLTSDITLHHRVTAGKAMLITKPLENPLRRVALLLRS